MVLQIDPSIAPVWVSPTTLRFGAERVRLILADLSRAEELLIHALQIGTSRSALSALAEQMNASADDVDRLLRRVDPVLTRDRSQPTTRVTIERTTHWPADAAQADTEIARTLRRTGVTLVTRDEEPDIAVLLCTHVIPPSLARYWLSRDIAAIPVVLGEESVTVGPLVLPGTTSCLHCVHLHLVDEDPVWTVVASQLLAEELITPVHVDPIAVSSASALLARALRAHARGAETGLEGTSVRFGHDDRISRREWAAHPRCSCRALPGNETGNVVPIGAGRAAPTTSAATSSRG